MFSGFGHLPDELVLKIFKYLPKKTVKSCALVCRRWQRIAYDTRLGLWRSTHITEVAVSRDLPMEIINTASLNGVRNLYVHLSKVSSPSQPTRSHNQDTAFILRQPAIIISRHGCLPPRVVFDGRHSKYYVSKLFLRISRSQND